MNPAASAGFELYKLETSFNPSRNLAFAYYHPDNQNLRSNNASSECFGKPLCVLRIVDIPRNQIVEEFEVYSPPFSKIVFWPFLEGWYGDDAILYKDVTEERLLRGGEGIAFAMYGIRTRTHTKLLQIFPFGQPKPSAYFVQNRKVSCLIRIELTSTKGEVTVSTLDRKPNEQEILQGKLRSTRILSVFRIPITREPMPALLPDPDRILVKLDGETKEIRDGRLLDAESRSPLKNYPFWELPIPYSYSP